MGPEVDLALVLIEELKQRRELGLKQYGKPVTPTDVENWLKHAKEEAQDLILYLMAAEGVVQRLREQVAEQGREIERLADDNERLNQQLTIYIANFGEI